MPSSSETFELGPFLLHRNKGHEHFEAENFALARVELEQAHGMRPEDAEVTYWLAMTYFRLDQHPEAERCFRRLLAIKPEVASLRVNRGIVLYKMNRISDAEEEFLRAIEIDRGASRPHLYLGLINARRADYRAALGHFEAAGSRVMAARMRARLGGGDPAETGPVVLPGPEESDAESGVPGAARPAPEAPAMAARRAGAEPEPDAPDPELRARLRVAPAEPTVRGEAAYTRYGESMVEVAFRGLTMIRRGALAGFAGQLRFEPSTGEEALLRVSGEGRMVLFAEGRRLCVLPIGAQRLHVELGHFMACDHTLSRELISLGRRDGLGMRVVALAGEGVVTVSTGGEPLLLSVDAVHPVSIAADRIVGWVGDLKPAPIRQGSMEDGAIGRPGALKLRFKGNGQLIVDPRRLEV